LAELGIKGFGCVLVNSNQVADRLGASHHLFNQLIESNIKFLNEFGQVTFEVVSREGGGRPHKHYMLNQGQVAGLASSLAKISPEPSGTHFMARKSAFLSVPLKLARKNLAVSGACAGVNPGKLGLGLNAVVAGFRPISRGRERRSEH
jgi:hypothetical protein